MKRNQRGLGVVGMFILAVGIVFAALFAIKVVPVWIEYLSLRKVLAAMATSGDLNGGTPLAVRQAFDRRADIDNIKVLGANDLEIKREGEQFVVSFKYQSVVPLFGNASLLFDFAGSSKDSGSLLPRRNDE